MKIPRIEFVYSPIYQEVMLPRGAKYKESFKYETKKFIKKAEKYWKKNEKKILKYITNITRIKWKDNLIKCYVLRKCYLSGISHPLTISIETIKKNHRVKIDKTRFIDILTHEIIHNLLTQDSSFEAYLKKLKKKYRKLSDRTIIHILVHAIHKAIYLKYFNRFRLNRDVKICQKRRDYAKAWEIVNKYGYENIIKEIKNYKK